MKKYYVEVKSERLGCLRNNVLQSKYFDTEEEAQNWVYMIDNLSPTFIKVLVTVTFDDADNCTDIKYDAYFF